MNIDEYYMQIALKEANKALKCNEVPVGAVIVCDNKIIAKGHNLREIKKDITKHAELITIKKASRKIKDWRLNNMVMYVTLFPCPMCASAIVQSRISKVVIGASSNDLRNTEIVNQIFKDERNKFLIEIKDKVLENECSLILKQFFQLQRKLGKK